MGKIKQSNIENFKSYSQFNTIKDFNDNVEMFLADHKDKLSKGEFVAFRRLTKFMAKVYGVCNAKIGTIVAATHDKNDMGGISRSTFKRMVSKLMDMGILDVIPLERKNGSKSSNLYVLNRYESVSIEDEIVSSSESNEPSNEEQLNHPKTNNLSKTNNSITKRNKETLDSTYSSDLIPERFKSLVSCYWDDAKVIESYWSRVKMIAYKFNIVQDESTILGIAIQSFKQLIRKIKLSSVNDNMAFFFGTMKKKLTNTESEVVSVHQSKQVIRKEMLPKWFKKDQQDESIQNEQIEGEEQKLKELISKFS